MHLDLPRHQGHFLHFLLVWSHRPSPDLAYWHRSDIMAKAILKDDHEKTTGCKCSPNLSISWCICTLLNYKMKFISYFCIFLCVWFQFLTKDMSHAGNILSLISSSSPAFDLFSPPHSMDSLSPFTLPSISSR